MEGQTIPVQRVGAKPGQIILFIDFNACENPLVTIERLVNAGHSLEWRYLAVPAGKQLIAVLLDKQFDPSIGVPEDYYETVEDEWYCLNTLLGDGVPRLWRGHVRQPVAA